MNRKSTLCVVGFLIVGSGAALAADLGPAPEAVSPGEPDAYVEIADRCPSLSWGQAEGATAYRLVVYEISGEGKAHETRVVIDRLVAGTALSWSPSLREGLAPGGRYGWAVRAQRQEGSSEWSGMRFFRISAAPSPRDVQRALEVLSSYVRSQAGEARGWSTGMPGLAGAEASAPGTLAAESAEATTDFLGTAAIRGEHPDPAGETYGVHGISQSATSSAAGVVGEARAATGATRGVAGWVASPDGVAGHFENAGGGAVLRGLGTGGEVFAVDGSGNVDAAGTVDATAFVGSGAGLTDLPAGDAPTLDGLDSTQFLRADASDAFTLGTLSLAAGTTLDVQGALQLPATGVSGAGAGSGLDADRVDGQHAADFLPAGTDPWVDETGDTMTGALVLPADGLAVGGTQLVAANGKVGVGTANPGETLSVVGSVSARGVTNTRIGSVHDNSASGIAGFEAFGEAGGSTPLSGGFVLAAAKDGGHLGVGANDPYLAIRSNVHSFHIGHLAPFLTVRGSNGRVGIGTTSPDARLQVNGTVKFVDGTQGAGKVLTSDAAGLASWQLPAAAAAVPAGAVMFFNLASCPTGWTALAAAKGRYLVGLPDGGTLAATVGTALSSEENREVGAHSHSASSPPHSHVIYTTMSGGTVAGGSDFTAIGPPYQANATESASATVTVSAAGTVAGTNAPYLELLVCQKD